MTKPVFDRLKESESKFLVPFGMLAASFIDLGPLFLFIQGDEAVWILLSDVSLVR